MDLKTFICSNFTNTDCSYLVTGEEDWVIQQADDHVCFEHAYTDSPELNKQIADSLIDSNPSPVDPTDDSTHA